jgi:hypothetical protein
VLGVDNMNASVSGRESLNGAAEPGRDPTPWSNGPIEGHINRLKAIKRQMYGRASFELLKARVLPWDASSAA